MQKIANMKKKRKKKKTLYTAGKDYLKNVLVRFVSEAKDHRRGF